jgi:hypothetical protein
MDEHLHYADEGQAKQREMMQAAEHWRLSRRMKHFSLFQRLRPVVLSVEVIQPEDMLRRPITLLRIYRVCVILRVG